MYGGATGVANSTRNKLRAKTAEEHKKAAANITFAVGDTVDHKVFGRGVVKKVDGDMLTVYFSKAGSTKKLMKDFAPIVKINS